MQLQPYPGCAFAVTERVGEDCGRDGLQPVILEEEEEEEEEASNPGLLLVEREKGPGKPSSTNAKISGLKKKKHVNKTIL